MAPELPTDNESPRRALILEELLERHGERLRRQALRHAPRPQDAEDALGDACMALLRFYDGHAGDQALHWMLLVVKRCAWKLGRAARAHTDGDPVRPGAIVERHCAESRLSPTSASSAPRRRAR